MTKYELPDWIVIRIETESGKPTFYGRNTRTQEQTDEYPSYEDVLDAIQEHRYSQFGL